jgi:hypothetical protein
VCVRFCRCEHRSGSLGTGFSPPFSWPSGSSRQRRRATSGRSSIQGPVAPVWAQAAAATRRLREQRLPCVPGLFGGTGFYNGRWASDTPCDPSHATFPGSIGGTTITQLVGFSLGRLGPLYFLKTADSNQEGKINYILMLDPGSSEISSNRCDTSRSLDATGLLRTWLGRNRHNRLFVLAGTDTQAGGHAGINNVYLRSLSSSTITGQVFVCDIGLAHDEVMSRFASMIGKSAPVSCPSAAPRRDLPSTPGSGGGAGQPPGAGGGDAGTGGPPSPPPTPAPTYAETTGGVAHTWTNYTNAGGYEGPTIPSNATVQIACALEGFRVADGNTWWYRIAQAPWSNAYFVSADAFYNNGETSGSLHGTPFVDGAVTHC